MEKREPATTIGWDGSHDILSSPPGGDGHPEGGGASGVAPLSFRGSTEPSPEIVCERCNNGFASREHAEACADEPIDLVPTERGVTLLKNGQPALAPDPSLARALRELVNRDVTRFNGWRLRRVLVPDAVAAEDVDGGEWLIYLEHGYAGEPVPFGKVERRLSEDGYAPPSLEALRADVQSQLGTAPDTHPTGEPAPPRANLTVAPEEAASPPVAASSAGALEHIALLRARVRILDLERLLARVATDLQSISGAVDATLAEANTSGLQVVSSAALTALLESATAALANPTPDALSDLRRAVQRARDL